MNPEIEPTIKVILEENDKLKAQMAKVYEDKAFISPSISDFIVTGLTTIKSTIVKGANEERMVIDWLPKKIKKLRLLYSGKKDGYDATTFHTKCDNIDHTLTIVEATNGKRFGGYSDQTWNFSPNSYKHSDKCYIFSLDMKERFMVKTPQYAVIC